MPSHGSWPLAAFLLLCVPSVVAECSGEGSSGLCSNEEDVSSLMQLRARTSHGLSRKPAAASNEPAATDVCVITAAIGADFVQMASLSGRTKEAYARKWNYTYLQYEWNAINEFLDWCHATELGSRFARQDLELNHPTLKYCVMDHALGAKGCKRALWTDADSVLMNWDIEVDFSWPGAVMSASGEPYAIYSMLSLPGGMQKNTGILHNDWCLTDSPCTNFKKFWTCLNSGVFVLNDSPASHQYMNEVINGTVSKMSRAVGCSTASYNPLKGDQCGLADGLWDQCMSGCVWSQENMKYGRDDDHMPDGVACADGSARPRIQEVFGVHYTEDPRKYVHADTYVVNVVGEVDKAGLLETLMKAFPHLSAAFLQFDSIA